MGLQIWDQLTDPYDHNQLAGNWDKVDQHDHSSGRGVQIPTGGIADGAITAAKIAAGTTLTIADGSVTTPKIANTAVTADKLADAARLGLTDSTYVRRGSSIITSGGPSGIGDSTINSTSFVTAASASAGLTTADQVSNLVLPTDGLIAILYQATWQESVAGAARAAIFLGANQLSIRSAAGAPITQAAATASTSTTAVDLHLGTSNLGIGSMYGQGTSAVGTDVTTGQVLGSINGPTSGPTFQNGAAPAGRYSEGVGWGLCPVFAAAGTYTISVQFKVSSGTLTVKNRKLWVWTIGF